MATVEFTGNYQDLSTDRGYQFKFYCEKCGNGYMSTFQTSTMGVATSVLEAANNLLGGFFGRAASTAYEVQRVVGGPAHDAALREATTEIRPLFRQCTRCGNWVCKPVCFNDKAGLCESCAPDLHEELAAAQAEAAREQVHQKAREVDWAQGVAVGTITGTACHSCGAKVQGGKFCPECGESLAPQKRRCPCGTEVDPSAKFCPECGNRF
jgi:hypothetical protein